jgi:hypothetical protein
MASIPAMTMEQEMEWLEGDINHLMQTQNRQEPDVDDRGFPVHNHLSEEIGRLERIWGQLYEKVYCART